MGVYEYVGCFFDYQELSEAVSPFRRFPLECEKKKPHVTFRYRPLVVDTDLFGTKVEVTVLGYGNNGENEGLLVSLSCDHPKLIQMIKKIETPHITLAVSKKGKAVNTRFLQFDAVKPIKLIGYYGAHREECL